MTHTTEALHIARCSKEAAKYAVLNWHYSEKVPSGRLISYGVWEGGEYVGAVVFGRGANPQMLWQFDLRQQDGCELVRVALRAHKAPVTQIVAEALRQLRASNPKLRIVVSYADPEQGHHGGIYKAGGWLYLGRSTGSIEYIVHGKRVHSRTINERVIQGQRTNKKKLVGETHTEWVQRWLDPDATAVYTVPKFMYVMPLDRGMRRKVNGRVLDPPEKMDGPATPRDTRRDVTQ